MKYILICMSFIGLASCTSNGSFDSCLRANQFLFGGLGGQCQAKGPVFAINDVPEDSSLLYIYRPRSFIANASLPAIQVDGNNVGQLKNGGFFEISVTPGEHSVGVIGKMLTTFTRDLATNVECGKGQRCFVKLSIEMGDVYVAGNIAGATNNKSIDAVPEAQALGEVKSLKKIGLIVSDFSSLEEKAASVEK